MYFLVYVSSAVEEFTSTELIDLLKVSRKNNTEIDVTGMLLYKDGNFLQVLEGEKEVVERLFNKISRDIRHRGLLVVYDGEVTEPEFSEWSMGFQNLSAGSVIDLPGYSDFMNLSFTGDDLQADPSIAYELLLMFKKNMR
jgi:hypothetical protein